jgi:hypothetical protein
LAEQAKNNGYGGNADNSMNFSQAMLAGRSPEALLNEKRSQDAKNRVSKSMISLYSNYQFESLTSKVDVAMPTRVREST